MQKKELSQYPIFIYDCDGVLLDSNDIKSQGFADTLTELGLNESQVEWAVDYHRKHGGVSRDTKFFNILNECSLIDPERAGEAAMSQVLRACRIYSTHVKERVCACNKIAGVEKFLQKIPPEAYVYVVSGARQEELREALHAHGLAPYFQGIFGSGPSGKSKFEWLDEIKSWTGLDLSQGIYFGDSILDFEAAKAFSMEFVFVHGSTDLDNWKEFCRTRNVRAIKDFKEMI